MRSSRSDFCTGLCAALLAVAPAAGAQKAPAQPGSIGIRVTRKDDGAPLLRLIVLNVHASPTPNVNQTDEAYADTSGTVELIDIPAGAAQHLAILCETNTPRPRVLDTATVVLKGGERRDVTLQASAEGCDQQPFIVRREMFVGVWEQNKTTSKFTPCDSLLPEAWVEFRPGALDSPAATWPADLHEDHPAFVRWDAILIGPWHYGDGGALTWMMSVQNIFELRAAQNQDCSAPSSLVAPTSPPRIRGRR